jgi:endonuclease/exonuclease/phosphatase family metal-dependent hydrolase
LLILVNGAAGGCVNPYLYFMPKSFFRRFTKKFFILCNISFAVLFLLGCYGYWFDPTFFWPLGFLTLGAFYLLLILLIFIFFWLFVKPAWSVISIVALLLAYTPLNNMIPFRFAADFIIKKDNTALRLMSWNVEHFDILEHKKHPETKAEMLSLINLYHPDIACFQEMVASDSFADAINYIPAFLQSLEFKDYYYSYNSKINFDSKHHYGIITFSKYPVINKQTIMWYPNDYNSIIQYVDVVKDGDTCRVFNIHLQSLRFSKENLNYIVNPEFEDKEAINQSRNIAGKFKVGFLKRKLQSDHIREEISKSPYKVIVCGDFNDVPNSYAYYTIGKGLQNAFEKKGSGLGRTFSGISPTLRIDNIFTDKAYSITQYTRINKKLSDHFPLFADLEIKK